MERLALVLGEAPPLLVIDEVEGLDLEPLSALLARRPGLRVLVTSRVVPELPADVLPIGPLDPASARALLTRRAEVADDAALQALLTRCEGVPLVLELAGAALERRPAAAVATLLAWDAGGLADDGHAGPAHHRSVRACIDRSLALLDSTHRDALIRLSVFRSTSAGRRRFSASGPR